MKPMRAHRYTAISLVVAITGVAACSDDASTNTDDGPQGGSVAQGGAGGGIASSGGSAPIPNGPIGGEDRPVDIHVPPQYDGSTPAPLVILLHGYTATGNLQESYLQLTPLADELGFLYLYPDGTVDPGGNHFWNATDACCDFSDSGVDDVAYLTQVIDDTKARYNVDPKRVYLIGHSNGGFMAHRMACERASTIAAIVSLAGATFDDEARCKPDAPVHVLQIHGTLDATIAYGGGNISFGGPYPSAESSASLWSDLNDCTGQAEVDDGALDLERQIVGSETDVRSWNLGCKPGGHAELWTIQGGSHIPAITDEFSRKAVEFLLGHSKP